MKHFFLSVAVLFSAVAFGQCNIKFIYPSWGNATTFNLNADPWEFNLNINKQGSADTTGCSVQWYYYDPALGESHATAHVFNGRGCHTVSECFAATDKASYLYYFCKVTLPGGCVQESEDFIVEIYGDCGTMSGYDVTISGVKTYTEGNRIQLVASYGAAGGQHHFQWFHNGVRVGEPEYTVQEIIPGVYPNGIPTDQRSIVDYKDDYGKSYLTIPACEVEDAGTWEVRVWDGYRSVGDTCFVGPATGNMNITPITKCPDWKWAIDGAEDLTVPMYPGKSYDISITTENDAPVPGLLIEAQGVTVNKPDTTGHTVTAHITIDPMAPVGTSIRMVATTGASGIRYHACADSIKPVIKSYGYLVFDDNNDTHVWSDMLNWWPNYNCIPTFADSAVIRKPCRVDISNAQAGDLTFEVNSDADLTILPTGALTVDSLTNPQAGDIIICADANNNGALVLSPKNKDIPASVEFYARSSQKGSLAPVWQYMGYPLQDKPVFQTAYPKADFYEWTNTPNPDLGGNWQQLDVTTKTADPFVGYCMTEEAEKVYTFSGLLNNPVLQNLNVPNNDKGNYKGFAFLANSWVAPIDIARLDVEDFGDADATVYIMNTGTYAEAIAQQKNLDVSGKAMTRGQYNAVPVHAAPYLDGALTVIPPMQGFFVHTTTATTLALDYQKSVFDAANHSSSVVPTRAPHRAAKSVEQPVVYRLTVNGFGAEDEVYLLGNDLFTNRFDNGWDGHKMHANNTISLAVTSEDGPLSVAAVPQLEGTAIRFAGSLYKYYTLTIHSASATVSDLLLWDVMNNVYTPMTDGAEYTFVYENNPDRFRIVRAQELQEETPVAQKFIRNGILYIRRGESVHDALGQSIK